MKSGVKQPSATDKSPASPLKHAKMVVMADAEAQSQPIKGSDGPARAVAGAMEIERLELGNNYSRWLDRFTIVAKFYRWDSTAKAQMLLMRLSTALYDTLADQASPKKPSELSYSEIETALTSILVPATFVLAERYSFQLCSRKSGESVRTYAERVLKAAEKCEFINKDERLRDQFICGLADQNVIGKLLVKDHLRLSFKEAVAEAEAHSALVSTDIMKSAPKSENSGIMSIGMLKSSSKPRIKGVNRQQSQTQSSSKCSRCGTSHGKDACPAYGKTCRKCGKQNHFQKMCRSKFVVPNQKNTAAVQHLDEHSQSDHVFMVGATSRQPLSTDAVTVTLDFISSSDKVSIPCQVDTGAAVSVMSDRVWKQIGTPELQPSSITLTGYTDAHQFKMLGHFISKVSYQRKVHRIPFKVVRSDRPFALLGRDILTIEIDFSKADGSEATRVFRARLELIPDAQPKYIKARSIPFAYKDRLKDEIDKLLAEGIIEPVTFSQWASPIVIVPKADGRLRLCVDYKQTLNPQLMKDSHPTPTPEEAFSTVAGCRMYTILDLKAAYNQVELEEDSKPLTVMSTPFGNYQYNRLVFGIRTAPSIFQRYISQVIQDVDGAIAYVDDILIGGESEKQLKDRESQVRERLEQHGLKVNEEKCQICQSRVRFLGFILDNGMILPDPEKVRALQEMETPKTMAELESLIGLVRFSGRFVPNLSHYLEPLTRLMRGRREFQWDSEQDEAFQRIKSLLTEDSALANYDPKKPVALECDASQKGLGGVLIQDNRPVLYISKRLSEAEKKYSQIEREALAIVWSTQRCQRFLAGRHFKLITDHRPLTYIFGPNEGLPTRVSARLQRWAISLMAFDYTIEYQRSQLMKSDALSRLLNNETARTYTIGSIQLPSTIISIQEVRDQSQDCPEIVLLKKAIRTSNFNDPRIRPYKAVADELTIESDVVLREMRVILPKTLRLSAVQTAHSTHLGIDQTKSLLRAQFWWPGLDRDVKQLIGNCKTCKMVKASNRNYLKSWPTAMDAGERVHADFAGPIDGQYLLVLVDAMSNYPEVHLTANMESSTVISRLRRTFSQWGVPRTLVTDNGPSFVSAETTQWLKAIGCSHVTTPPYHPQSNGLAERFVRTMKESVSALGLSQHNIDKFLLFYRSSKGNDGRTPSEKFLGRNIRTPLMTEFSGDDNVVYRTQGATSLARIVLPTGRNTAIIKLENGLYKKAHRDQIQSFKGSDDKDVGPEQATTGAAGEVDHPPAMRPGEEEREQQQQQPRRSERLMNRPTVNYKE
ncbi:hypothetical protein BOX15_Mlig005755g5 [Macrostomum lignano]|uniref:RNA-directed DNA polymerase n=1 Tax=Macrostomum lignano TaxID=282301 RepID=A0A267DPS0_9PLAT|nr:hypothetical protein BOX15_Mlig005755g5 [Macrostomum lignano]